jgi:hypothetical protein
MAAVLASLVPTTSSRVYAQGTVYYNPYGQGPYGGYGQPNGNMFPSPMFPSQGGMFGPRVYEYSGYGNVPYGYGNRFNYGISPNVRVYGRSSYYQPSYGPVYVPFGYRVY